MQYTSAIRSAIRQTDSCDRETSFEVSNSSTTVILYLFNCITCFNLRSNKI